MGKHFKEEKKKHKLLIFVLIMITILALAYIINYFLDKKEVEEESDLLNTVIVKKSEVVEQKTERMLKVEKLQKDNSDIIGWIEIKNTNINYPVLQCNDNSFYMDHNYKKEKSIYGSIFLDKSYNWDTPSSNLLMYGHNMKDGSMFNNLLKYKNKKYYKEHPTIRFTTKNEDNEYEIISAFYSRVYYKSEKNVFRYYYFIDAENEKEYNEFVDSAKKESIYDTEKTAEYGDKLITLSTCSYHTKDGRFAVVARCKDEK